MYLQYKIVNIRTGADCGIYRTFSAAYGVASRWNDECGESKFVVKLA